MRTTRIALGCILLTICLSYVPRADGVACTAPDVPTGCTDCALPANAASPDCPATTPAPTTTVAAPTTAAGDTTTAASTVTTTAATTTGTTKKRVKKMKFKIVKKNGKKVYHIHHKGGKKSWLLNKFSHNES